MQVTRYDKWRGWRNEVYKFISWTAKKITGLQVYCVCVCSHACHVLVMCSLLILFLFNREVHRGDEYRDLHMHVVFNLLVRVHSVFLLLPPPLPPSLPPSLPSSLLPSLPLSLLHVLFFSQNFYKSIGREEIYLRYIYRLSELHKQTNNWIEAAFTLLLHAQLLQVTNSIYSTFDICKEFSWFVIN